MKCEWTLSVEPSDGMSYDVTSSGTLADFVKAFDAETKNGNVYHLDIKRIK
jgi:hypothetical protein